MTSMTGLVLSGGGARGAYEAGVLQGLIEVLGPQAREAPFRVVAGTSVGAINGAWMVANAHHPDHRIHDLVALWRRLELREHLRLDLLGAMGWAMPLKFLRKPKAGEPELFGRSVLNATALENMVRDNIDWPRLHDNVATGVAHAFIVAALHIGTGVTTMFAEMERGFDFSPSKNPRHIARVGPVNFEHVMASAAIPALFPARRISHGYFADGGLRFNTPISPAIRAGAQKLVVITLRHDDITPPDLDAPGAAAEQYPSVTFLLGKLFNALLLDPVAYDLKVTERFNALMEVLETTLKPEELERVDAVLEASRGMAYRRIRTLSFEPSANIGLMAGEHLRRHGHGWNLGRFYEWLLARAGSSHATWEADLASYLLFDGAWAGELIDLGRRDAHAKADEVRSFFAE